MAEDRKYRYKPIKEEHGIRLLEIWPAKEDEPLQCHVIHTSLDVSPSYDAISYTWGSSDRTHKIALDGAHLNITSNLHEVLSRFRDLEKPRLIWADGISIDQENIPERNDQVALMGDIYRGAREVLIYLGREEHESETLPALFESLKEVTPLLDSEEVTIWADDFNLSKYGLPPQEDSAWLAVALFWTRPWFSRLWVLQECILAAKPIIYCGTWAASWDQIFPYSFKAFNAIHLAHNNTLTKMGKQVGTSMGINGCKAMSRLRYFRMKERETTNTWTKASLAQLLEVITYSQCSDPRDKLFGLLSIAADGQHPEFAADYSLDAKQISLKYARHMLRGGQPFWLLAKITSDTAEDDLPSWCPNLTELRPHFKVACDIYNASANQSPQVIVSETSDEITVLGYYVDEVATLVSSPYQEMREGGPSTWLEEIDSLLLGGRLEGPDKTPITAEEEDPKWRFLVGNCTLAETRASIETFHHYAAFIDMSELARAQFTEAPLPVWTTNLPETEMRGKTREATLFMSGLNAMRNGRRAAVTREGRLAWVPDRAEAGDAVCILSGWRAPFVLRPVGEDSWKLLGEAYLEGIMEGEALRDGTSLVQQDFKIV